MLTQAYARRLGQHASLPTIPYRERLRKHRRWILEGVGNMEKLHEYQHIQRREVRNLVRHLVEDPANFRDHLHLYVQHHSSSMREPQV